MINVRWHKRKHQEAQAEWDGWRQIEAEGEAQVKYPHITIADSVDNRPLKVRLSSSPLKTTPAKGRATFICAEGEEGVAAYVQVEKKGKTYFNSSMQAKGVQAHSGY